MTIKEYFARPGAHYSDTDAQVIGPELTKLASKGQSSAGHIVNAAQKQNSPLHEYFEWDDAQAAKDWRLQQARHMAHGIAVRIEITEGETREVRAFHPVFVEIAGERSKERHYLPIEVIQAEPDYREQILAEARAALESFRRRFKDYGDIFGPVFSAIDEVMESEEMVAA